MTQHPNTPMQVRTTPVGAWQMNAYALICPHTRQSVLIDPGADPDALSALLADSTPQAILITHTHADHIDALEAMRKRMGVPVFSAVEPHFDGVKIHTDRVLAAGDEFTVGGHTLRVHATPGHCVDQIAFQVLGEPIMIVGDAVFAGGPGRTSSTANFAITLNTLRDVVLRWPDDVICYPGHGPTFRLGDKRAAIAAFAAREHGGFFGDAEW
jgi:hydroxyacylglutathione hydrolase